nr:unnamed protein product [Callosobruchus chinensis]
MERIISINIILSIEITEKIKLLKKIMMKLNYFIFSYLYAGQHDFIDKVNSIRIAFQGQVDESHLPKNARILKEGALPTLKLPLGRTLDGNAGSERSNRITKRRRQKEVDGILACSFEIDPQNITAAVQEQPSTSTATSEQEIGEYNRHINRDTGDTGYIMIIHHNNDDKIKQLEEKKALLQEKIALLQEENQRLLKKIAENISKERNIRKIFSPGQIKRLLNPEKKFSRWSPEDIASAISLRSVSPKAYKYLRTNGYPLPALSTLRTWAATFDLKPGLLKGVCSLLLLKKKQEEKLDLIKIVRLSWCGVY